MLTSPWIPLPPPALQKDEVYLNLVMEYVPETIYRSLRTYVKAKQNMPMILIKLYMYQLFRSLVYIHSMGICHRDIKPQNLLLNAQAGILKLCDFGSAKILNPGEPNVSYICSRYYRAPELIFGATNYTTSIGAYRFFDPSSLIPLPSSYFLLTCAHACRHLVYWVRHGRVDAGSTAVPWRERH